YARSQCLRLSARSTYTLSLHDALPICLQLQRLARQSDHALDEVALRLLRVLEDDDVAALNRPHRQDGVLQARGARTERELVDERSEEHTSELQSRVDLVCRLLLESKT